MSPAGRLLMELVWGWTGRPLSATEARHETPGTAYDRLSEATKQQLSRLTSDDLRDVRLPPWIQRENES